jgi:ion channel-forming bestrophin family protein
MHTGRTYSLIETIVWTKRYILIFIVIGAVPVLIHQVLGYEWLVIPWLPVALIGTAVAFLIGFKNSASYDRMWEARKIWGEIINLSRAWAIKVKGYFTTEFMDGELPEAEIKSIQKKMIYRHLAWLTALRFQLRTPRNWESMVNVCADIHYQRNYEVQEITGNLEAELKKFLEEGELKNILSKDNRATHIVASQSEELKRLRHLNLIEDFRHIDMQNLLDQLYTQQGKSERIKNFPYPRQFATMNLFFVWIFISLIPFGMIQEFEKLGHNFVWATIPFTVLVSWVFHTMERIGEASENPFEGGPNDVPITSLARTIEIDLREMLDETDIPPKIEPKNNILS